MKGWVSFHRKIMQWEWYTDANTFRLFFHLILNANHHNKKWRGKTIKKGQLVTGRKELAAQLKLSEQQIRTSLNKLKLTNEITTKATNRYTIVTIVKYEFYQSDEGRITNKTTSKATNKKPTNNQQITTNNNDNNDNNVNNSNNKTISATKNETKNQKTKDQIPYKEIVDFLNKSLRTNYRYTTNKTKELIKARWNEGFRQEDFEQVVKTMKKDWQGTKYEKYLRPITLFGSKFESYLNQKSKSSNSYSKASDEGYTMI